MKTIQNIIQNHQQSVFLKIVFFLCFDFQAAVSAPEIMAPLNFYFNHSNVAMLKNKNVL